MYKYDNGKLIGKNGKPIGYFDNLEDAKNAYLCKKREIHDTCTI
jgi:hypothetical protein